MKHSPLPWYPVCGYWILPPDSKTILDGAIAETMNIGSLPAKANAEFICRAANSHYELVEALERAQKLVRLVTVHDVINAGDEAIDAAGLNPYCMNEGLATGNTRISPDFIDFALARAKGETA